MSKTKKVQQCNINAHGMHCPSCEILIEKKLNAIDNIRWAKSNHKTGQVCITFHDDKPNLDKINQELTMFGYKLSYDEIVDNSDPTTRDYMIALGTVAVFIFLFLLLEKAGIASRVIVDAKSSIPAFFLFGVVAGTSSCAALVGGMLLSAGKTWNKQYSASTDMLSRAYPYVAFNVTRAVSYAIFGGILGIVGASLGLSLYKTAFLLIIISSAMILLGLQMIGIKGIQSVALPIPKSFTRFITRENSFANKFMPAVLGGLTFFLPCGFTLIAQSAALASSSFTQGALIMGAFSLGTLPVLSVISYTSLSLGSSVKFGKRFSIAAGALVVIFALYTINSQLNVLGAPSISSLATQLRAQDIKPDARLVPIQNGVQIMSMEAGPISYSPSSFVIKSGLKTKWMINDTGTSGCTSTLISNGIFNGLYQLKRGANIIEFTAPTPGRYAFSCSMGMVSGTIDVI